MKINDDFNAVLRQIVAAMHVPQVAITIATVESKDGGFITKLASRAGLEVKIEDLKLVDGVFSYQGQHVLLYIKDHSLKFDETVKDPKNGNKYHLTDCSTLEKMRSKKRFGRYHATTNIEGLFEIEGDYSRRAEVRLNVCKVCLRELNYQNYVKNKSKVFAAFDLTEFFKAYESSFGSEIDLGRVPKSDVSAGYASDWNEISNKFRESKGWCCEQCGVNLSSNKNLLHVHHKNHVKRNNAPDNLMALCVECHSIQPGHGHMKVKMNDKFKLRQLRMEQGITYWHE